MHRPYYQDEWTMILHANATEALEFLKRQGVKVQAVVTSPPFYGQRDYGHPNQIGLEDHPQQFIERLVNVFRLCRDVLDERGTLWVNMGDTYWSGRGAQGGEDAKQSARRFGLRPQDKRGDGGWCRPKQMLLLPHRLAVALQDDGWLARNDNIWRKPNPVPDQVDDRCQRSHEHVFMFSKRRNYYWDKAPVGIPSTKGTLMPPFDTWDSEVAHGASEHSARFSTDLVRVPVLAGCPPGGWVLDPFAGAGTTLHYARSTGRRGIGVDILEDHCRLMLPGGAITEHQA